MMISEAGTVLFPGADSPTATWYDAIPGVLERHPAIKAVTLWDHTGSNPHCDFRFEDDPDVLASVQRAAADPRMGSPIDSAP